MKPIKNLPKYIYHATPAQNVQSILHHGLKPNVGTTAYGFPAVFVYLTLEGAEDLIKDFNRARHYSYIIIQINTSKLRNKEFFVDEWMHNQKFRPAFTKSRIPAKAIKVLNEIKASYRMDLDMDNVKIAQKLLKVAKLLVVADHMEPEVVHGKWWVVDCGAGSTCYVPDDVLSHKDDLKIEEGDLSPLVQYCEEEPQDAHDEEGWGGRMQAPGYLDNTPWVGVFKTKEEALNALKEMFGE